MYRVMRGVRGGEGGGEEEGGGKKVMMMMNRREGKESMGRRGGKCSRKHDMLCYAVAIAIATLSSGC